MDPANPSRAAGSSRLCEAEGFVIPKMKENADEGQFCGNLHRALDKSLAFGQRRTCVSETPLPPAATDHKDR